MPVHARRMIRKMRGGAQAHLIECDDRQFYVVKFVNNPQHRRILVNELISAVFLDYLQIAAPAAAIVEMDEQFLADNSDLYIRLGTKRIEVAPGWHFGSRYPGDPNRLAVYDFLPDPLLDKVVNLGDLLGAFAFDKWMGNADARQAIFFRARLKDWLAPEHEHPQRVGFVTQMIDHGFVFNGPDWTFVDSPLQGLYFRRTVYRGIGGLDGFAPWLDRIVHFPESVVDRAWKQIPPGWMEGEEQELEGMLGRLMRRRERLPELIREAAEVRDSPFPNWGRS